MRVVWHVIITLVVLLGICGFLAALPFITIFFVIVAGIFALFGVGYLIYALIHDANLVKEDHAQHDDSEGVE